MMIHKGSFMLQNKKCKVLGFISDLNFELKI